MHDRTMYAEVIAMLNSRNNDIRTRQHRLPSEQYAFSDSEYHITTCARWHGQPFRDHTLATRIIDALLFTRDKLQWNLYCYCLMPDHLHFILRLPKTSATIRNGGQRGMAPAGVLDAVGDFKSYTTSKIWWTVGGQQRLWQRSSYDRVLRHQDSADDAVRYVLNNPVRKALVDVWDEYPYSGLLVEF